MIVVKKFSSPLEVAKFIRGEEIASGTITSAISSGTAMADTAAEWDGVVAAGDVVYFAGVDGSNTVASVASDVSITLDDTTSVDNGADYRICRTAYTLFGSDQDVELHYCGTSATWVLIYDTTDWSN